MTSFGISAGADRAIANAKKNGIDPDDEADMRLAVVKRKDDPAPVHSPIAENLLMTFDPDGLPLSFSCDDRGGTGPQYACRRRRGP